MEELILKNEEFKEKIVQDINESQLPAFILKPIIKDIYEQIITLEKKQCMEAKNNREKEKKQNKKEVK